MFTLLALAAFASNSLLTRLALGAHQIGAAAFTNVRLLSGAATLFLLARLRSGRWPSMRPVGVSGPIALAIYAAPFSFAYLRIGAAVGALVMFGAVQLTMLGYGLVKGERPRLLAWCGIALAVGGLVVLTLRSVGRPDPLGLALMAIAGLAWGAYSISGRSQTDPVSSNARSFLWSAPVSLILALVLPHAEPMSMRGVALAVTSGAVTSGLGYVVWYRALQRLTITQASVAQLCVPVLAAIGAVALLGETLTGRLVVSGAMVLGGIGLVLVSRSRARAIA